MDMLTRYRSGSHNKEAPIVNNLGGILSQPVALLIFRLFNILKTSLVVTLLKLKDSPDKQFFYIGYAWVMIEVLNNICKIRLIINTFQQN